MSYINNDTHGHDAGDRVLAAAATLLKNGIRGIDLLGRYGGEEFLIICPNADQSGAQVLAERLRKTIADTLIDAGSSHINVTASFGVFATVIDSPDMGLTDAVRIADAALYQAKSDGRNCVRGARM